MPTQEELQRYKRLEELLIKHKISPHSLPIDWLKSTDFFSAPASTRFHAAYSGGLFDHCYNVATTLIKLTEQGVIDSWSRPESPIIIGMLHDVTKINAYIEKECLLGENNTIYTGYMRNPLWESYGPHGYDSVCKILTHTDLTEEELYCIRFHMGAYETQDWDGFDLAIRKYPNVLYTHLADMIASKLMED